MDGRRLIAAGLWLGVVLATVGACEVGETDDEESSGSPEIDGEDDELGSAEDAILNGNNVGDTVPHGVAALFTRDAMQNPVFRCSAVMLTDRWAMTAAHCFNPDLLRFPSKIEVGVQPRPALVQAMEIIVHPDPERDQALVRLAAPIQVHPTQLGWARQISGQPTAWAGSSLECWGYGLNGDGPNDQTNPDVGLLLWAQVPVVGTNADEITVGFNVLAPNVFQQPIFGDSGGPCYDAFGVLVGTCEGGGGAGTNTDYNATTPTRGWEGQARTTQTIVAAESGLCLDVWGVGQQDGADLQTYPCQGWDNQDFRLVEMDGGFHQIRAEHSGKCIGISQGEGVDAIVRQGTCDHDPTSGRWQQFRVEDVPGTTQVRFVHRQTNLCLDRGNGTVPHTLAQLEACNGSAAQRWSMTSTPEAEAVRHSLKNAANAKCMNLSPGDALVSHWDCFGVPQEEFTVAPAAAAPGFHQLKLGHSGQCLHAIGGYHGSKLMQQACAQHPSQDWKLQRRQGGYQLRNRNSDLCIAANPNGANGQFLLQETCSTTENRQIWRWQ
jgi:hypothetical protein